jgi:D-alanyl-D-alanine carboxypeptidase
MARMARAFGGAVIASGLALCGFGQPRLGDTLQLPDFEVQRPQLQAIRQAAVPQLTAKAALLLDFASNRTLYAKAAGQPVPPASTTKIMTALLTLEQGGVDDLTTVSARAAAEPGTTMNLAAGERLSVRELLYGLLLPSGNDAALTLAERDAGSIQAFVDRMNARAQALGLKNTHYADPDGIDDAHDRMSAYDVSQLARFALNTQPLFSQIVKTAHYTIPAEPGHPAFDLTNLNQLLGTYPGADGVKTGTTPGAGENLVATATQNGHRLMAVVYDATDRYADARSLLNNGFGNWFWFRTDQYFPFATPFTIANSGDVLLPAWERGQTQVFVDADAATAHFTLAMHELAVAPVQGLASTPRPS